MNKIKIIDHEGKIRLIKSCGKYSVQAYTGFLFWKSWKNISFGPFYPMRCGYSRFYHLSVAQSLYKKCIKKGEYTTIHYNYRYGVK